MTDQTCRNVFPNSLIYISLLIVLFVVRVFRVHAFPGVLIPNPTDKCPEHELELDMCQLASEICSKSPEGIESCRKDYVECLRNVDVESPECKNALEALTVAILNHRNKLLFEEKKSRGQATKHVPRLNGSYAESFIDFWMRMHPWIQDCLCVVVTTCIAWLFVELLRGLMTRYRNWRVQDDSYESIHL